MFGSASARSIPACLFEVAEANPHHLAFVDPPSLGLPPVTYGDFKDRSIRVASCLMEFGVEAGDRVGLLSVGRSWWPICDVAVMTIGALTVPIYPSLPASQISFIVSHSGMAGIFVENQVQYQKLLEAHQMTSLPLKFVVMLDKTSVEEEQTSPTPWPVFQYSEWAERKSSTNTDILNGLSNIDPSRPATIVYTSGTTGTPKGVILTHENILSNMEAAHERFELRQDDIHLSYLPLSHILERMCGAFIPLSCGSTICYAESVDAIADEFRRVRPTIFTTVPRLLEKVEERIEATVQQAGGWRERLFRRAIAAGWKASIDGQTTGSFKLALYNRLVFNKIKRTLGGRMRLVVSGGAPLAPHVCRFFWAMGIPVCEGYGMTETSPIIAFNAPGDKKFGTVGRKLANVELRLEDDGELLVKGPNVFGGYYHNKEADESAFTEDGWLKTGDIATVSADGYVRITDRKKHLIVLSTGKKVTPAPIENDMLQSPYIDQVCLIGQGRKFVAAIVVPDKDMVRKWLANETAQDVAMHPPEAFSKLLLHEATRTTTNYARFEQPKQIIVAEPFTIENGMLTPTLKVKAARVCEVYADAIEALYHTGTSSEKFS